MWPSHRLVGGRAALVLATFGVFVVDGVLVMFDAMLTAAVLLSLLVTVRAYQTGVRAWWFVCGIGVGLGELSKGLVVLVHVLPGALLMPLWAERARRPSVRRWYVGVALSLIVALAVAALWLLPAVIAGGAEYRQSVPWQQTAGRMVSSFAHERPIWYLLALLPIVVWPWMWWPPLWSSLRRNIDLTDPRSNATSQAFDALNRLVTVTDALTNDADYGYNAADDLTDVTDQRALVTSFVQNSFGDVIRRNSPDTGNTDYEYDSAGNLTKQTDARNIVTNFTNDDLNRRTAMTFPASTGENVTYSYDDAVAGNKGKGRLTKIEDESGSTAFFYDARGNVTKETRVIGTQTYVTEYAFDGADRLSKITYPSGRVVSYARDTEGRVTSVATQKTGASAIVIIASNITYLPFGPSPR